MVVLYISLVTNIPGHFFICLIAISFAKVFIEIFCLFFTGLHIFLVHLESSLNFRVTNPLLLCWLILIVNLIVLRNAKEIS
jgi:hypothetical protein